MHESEPTHAQCQATQLLKGSKTHEIDQCRRQTMQNCDTPKREPLCGSARPWRAAQRTADHVGATPYPSRRAPSVTKAGGQITNSYARFAAY